MAAPVGQPQIGGPAARRGAEDRRRRLVEEADLLHRVLRRGGVHVEGQDRDPELAGVIEDQPLRVHPRVVGQDAGEEGRRVVGLEPGGLIGRQREGRGVRLAEPERGERLQHLPHPLDEVEGVALGVRGREEPHPHLLLPLGAAEGAADLVRLREGAAGHHLDDHQHLLMEDHHAVGLLQRRPKVVVEVLRRVPALPGGQERPHHVAFHRPGPEQRDVGDQVLERLGGELPDQLALTRGLDLEDAEGLGRLDQLEGPRIVPGDRVDVDVLAVDAGHFPDGVGHRGLHPDPEQVELEQPEGLHVVLVELAHRMAEPARLDGGPVEQGAVGQQHPTRVQRDVAGQAVEPLDQLQQQVEAAVDRRRPELRQVPHRLPHLVGADVREGLREAVDLPRRQAQGCADVADAVPRAVGVHHRHAGAALAAVPAQDLLVHLHPPGGLDVDVDVGQLVAQRRQEPLHQQPVADRVHVADAEQVVHQRAGARSAGSRPDPQLLNEVHDVGHRQEVRGEAEPADHGQLVVQSAQGGWIAGHPPSPEAGLAPVPQDLLSVTGVIRQLREVHLTEAEVPLRVDRTPVRLVPGPSEQATSVVGQAGAAGHLRRHVGHLLAGQQRRLGVGPVDMTGIQRHQPAAGVEDVRGGGVGTVGVTHHVGQHRTGALVVGEPEQPGGPAQVSWAAVVHHLDDGAVRAEDVPPARQVCRGQVGPALHQGPSELAAGTEQDSERALLRNPARVRGDQLQAGDRRPPFAREVGGGDQPAQRRPAAAVPREQGDAGQRVGGKEGAPARRCPFPRRGRYQWADGQVDPEDRPDSQLLAGLRELHGPVRPVPVGQGKRVHAVLGGPLDQHPRVRGAVPQGVAAGDVQVDERIHREPSGAGATQAPRGKVRTYIRY